MPNYSEMPVLQTQPNNTIINNNALLEKNTREIRNINYTIK